MEETTQPTLTDEEIQTVGGTGIAAAVADPDTEDSDSTDSDTKDSDSTDSDSDTTDAGDSDSDATDSGDTDTTDA